MSHRPAPTPLPPPAHMARSQLLEEAFTAALEGVLSDLQQLQHTGHAPVRHMSSTAGLMRCPQAPEDVWLYLLHLFGQLHRQGCVVGCHTTDWVLRRLKVLAPPSLATSSVEAMQPYMAAWAGLLPLLRLCCQDLPPLHPLRTEVVAMGGELLRSCTGEQAEDHALVLAALHETLHHLLTSMPTALVQLPEKLGEWQDASGALSDILQATHAVKQSLAHAVRCRYAACTEQ